jgi:hypothetical protein
VTFPAATFTSVAPPPDGLAVAFRSARRRRNSKAAVSAFGGAVAIASALSFLAPPGQSLVQEPAQPANGVLLTGQSDPPPHGAPPVQVGTTGTTRLLDVLAPSTHPVDGTQPMRVRSSAPRLHHSCGQARVLACAVVRTPADGPTMHASVCPAAANVTVEYHPPSVVPPRRDTSRTVEIGSCPG